MITVVTSCGGRAGSSLMMQMLQAAGVPLYWTRLPNRTIINPFGHYELAGPRSEWTPEFMQRVCTASEGKAIKVFARKLDLLPLDSHDFQFIELKRDPVCQNASQGVMLREENRLHEKADPRRTPEGVILGQRELDEWLTGRRRITVWFNELFDGRGTQRVADWLGLDALAVAKMNECVEPSLWHFKPGIDVDPETIYRSQA